MSAVLVNPMPHQYVTFKLDDVVKVFYIMQVNHRLDGEGYWREIYGYWMKREDIPKDWVF